MSLQQLLLTRLVPLLEEQAGLPSLNLVMVMKLGVQLRVGCLVGED
jgi:hypothetical protein